MKNQDKRNKKLAKVHHFDLYGDRKSKYEFLDKNTVETVKWKILNPVKPYYFFVPKDFRLIKEYEKGFKVDELFKQHWSGVKFRKDSLLIKNHFDKKSVKQLLWDMQSLSDIVIHKKYGFKDTKDWKLKEKRALFKDGDYDSIIPILYRPFDIRYTYYPFNKINEIIPRGDARRNMTKHMLKQNIAVIINRQIVGNYWSYIGVTTIVNSHGTFYLGNKGQDYTFPLYLYSEDGTKTPNFNQEILAKITANIGKITPEKLFDYIYAILHSPTYRERYKEFLKIDFPRIPYPTDKKLFNKLVKIGTKLRELHLMESPKLEKSSLPYPEGRPDDKNMDIVEQVKYQNGPSTSSGRVYINPDQYFGKVPKLAWNFYIGGYQPAQKWLKDRKGRTLSNEEIVHYQKIIFVLVETDKLMKKIDKVIPKWPIK